MSAFITSLKTVLSYFLWFQLVIQFDAYGTAKKNPETVVLVEVHGIKIDMPLLAVTIASFSFLVSMAILMMSESSGTAGDVKPKKKAKKILLPEQMFGNRPNKKSTLDVVVVGCGVPKRGMGWYHVVQLLDMPSVNVRGVVEPFFMNKKLCPSPPPAFEEFLISLAEDSVPCVKSVTNLPKFTKDTMCLIAGRTADNPGLTKACIEHGAKVIYLEKPGAPSVAELEEMSAFAKSKGVKIYLGYNKNVTPYVQKALAKTRSIEHAEVVFTHNNSYDVNELPECFSRNAEGMMKNMAIHELALLVTFFGVTVDTIKEFKVNTNKLFTESLTVWAPGSAMPNVKYISDFSRVGFSITTKNGKKVSVVADRCGGNISSATVRDAKGMEVEKFEFPDEETQKRVAEKCAADPEMMPYFFVQSSDYLELKARVIVNTLKGATAAGVATIETGIDALKLAEYCTDELNKALKKTEMS